MVKEDTFDKNTKNPVEKFLSEVLKITDLKRLMKDSKNLSWDLSWKSKIIYKL